MTKPRRPEWLSRFLVSLFGSTPQPGPDTRIAQPAGSDPFDWGDTADPAHRVHLLLQEGKSIEAEALLLKLLRSTPGSRSILTQLAEIAEARQDWPGALSWWSRIRLGSRDIWQTDIPRARIFLKQGRAEEARRILLTSISTYDGNIAVLFYVAKLASLVAQPARDELVGLIRPNLSAFVQRSGENTETLLTRAYLAEAQGLVEEAYQCLRQAHLLRPLDTGLREAAQKAARRIGVGEADLSV